MLYINCVNLKQFAITKSKKTCPEKKGGGPSDFERNWEGGPPHFERKEKGGPSNFEREIFRYCPLPPLD